MVVLTRAPADNVGLRRGLEQLGATVIERPMIEVMPPADDGVALVQAIDRLGEYDWLVLTSVNGVRAVADANGDRAWPPGLRVAAVGPATAEAATEVGLAVEVVPERATAADLVAGVVDAVAEGACRVLAAVAELASDTVEVGLTAKGHQVDRVTAYRTVQPAGAAVSVSDPDVADAIAFFSPSAVSRYVDRFGAVPPVVVCIGPVTSARAGELGLAGVTTAEPYDNEGVLSALASALALGP